MLKKVVIALVVIGSFVMGYTGFIVSPAQASNNCVSNNTLAANPELLKVNCSQIIVQEITAERAPEAEAARVTGLAEYFQAQQDGTGAQRANEASAARYTGLAKFYGVEDEISLANNPELLKIGFLVVTSQNQAASQQ
jgi:hypothetical protein